MLKPKKTKYRKYKKSYFKRNNSKGVLYLEDLKGEKICFKSLQNSGLTAKQIETFQQTFNRMNKGKSKLELKIFPTIPITRKPTEARMGKGKGSVEFWTAYVMRGTALFESFGKINEKNKKRLRSLLTKLPFRVSFSK